MTDVALPRNAGALKDFLREHGLRPQKRFGQNFMIDPNAVAAIVRDAAIAPGDTVLEVGAGTGLLTLALLEADARVTTVEADTRLAAVVGPRLESVGARVIVGDVLDGKHALALAVGAAIDAAGPGGYRVVANLPYNASVPFLVNLLRAPARPRVAVVTVQREVADRLVATAGDDAYGRVSVELQLRATVERLRDLPAAVFWPRPAIRSSVVRITPHPDGMCPAPSDVGRFDAFVARVFGQRRKRIASLIDQPRVAVERVLDELGLARDVRAEVLAPDVLVQLCDRLETGS